MERERDRKQDKPVVAQSPLKEALRPASDTVLLQRTVPGTKVRLRVFNADEWEAHKEQLMWLEENAYGAGGVHFDVSTKKELMTGNGSIAVVAENEKGVIIGECYGVPLSEEAEELEEGGKEIDAFKHVFDKYRGKKVFYIDGFGVAPEYRGGRIGTGLKRALLAEAKEAGYEFVIGHINAGIAFNINMKFGAKALKYYDNWYGSNETHVLYEIELKNMQSRLKVENTVQETDYTCGPASLRAVLSFWGIKTGEKEIVEKTNTTEEEGTSHEGMRDAAVAYGMQTVMKSDASMSDIEHYIDAGMPVIVNFYLRDENEGHYSAVTGYDSDNLFIMDVEHGKERPIDKSTFVQDWFSKRYGPGWMMVMYPKQPVKEAVRE